MVFVTLSSCDLARTCPRHVQRRDAAWRLRTWVNPLGGDKTLTQTWWGNAIRSVIHYGTFAGGVVLGAKGVAAAGIGGGISAGASWLAGAGSAGFGNPARGAAVGTADLLSEFTRPNPLGELLHLLDTPLLPRTWSPTIKTLKRSEGMGIGIVVTVLSELSEVRAASKTKYLKTWSKPYWCRRVEVCTCTVEDAVKAAVEKVADETARTFKKGRRFGCHQKIKFKRWLRHRNAT